MTPPTRPQGALHALAGAAIGLRQDVAQFLPNLLPPVLASFTDQDARVRYYGCEALYNIAKVARASCVAHFNPIFDGLFKLSADTDLQARRRTDGGRRLARSMPPKPALAVARSMPTRAAAMSPRPHSPRPARRCKTACSCSTGCSKTS